MNQSITFEVRYPIRGGHMIVQQPPLPEGFFVDKVPPEILGLICKATGNSRDRSFLCRVNHFFHDVCTSTLYGSDIKIIRANNLSCLCDTLSSLRPALAVMIKSLDVRAEPGWYNLRQSGSRSLRDLSMELEHRFKTTMNKCVNLESLTVMTPGAWEVRSTLSAAFAPDLSLPSLRHLSLQFNMKDPVYEFIQRHISQLHGIDVNYAPPDLGDEQIPYSHEISSRYRAALPPSCSTFCGSPILVPVYIPGSFVEDVCLSWDVEAPDIDAFAPNIIRALSNSNVPTRTISYLSPSWNLAFVYAAAMALPSLEALVLEAYFDRDAEPEFVGVSHTIKEILPYFKALKMFVITTSGAEDTPQTPQSFDRDFHLVKEWAPCCPSLVFCSLPFTRSRWIRHPKYDFFLPEVDASPRHGRRLSAYSVEWLHGMIERNGIEWETKYHQHSLDLKASEIPASVKSLRQRVDNVQRQTNYDRP